MRIAIVTLPLHTNYGGLLQAYALKAVLEGIGNDVTVLDMVDKMPAPKGLSAPLVQGIDPEDDGEFFLSDIDWEAVDEVLDEKRALSLEFLKKSLAVTQDAPMVK